MLRELFLEVVQMELTALAEMSTVVQHAQAVILMHTVAEMACATVIYYFNNRSFVS